MSSMEPKPVSRCFADVEGGVLTWGCPILDLVFASGVPVGSVTEIVSESGVGKTQLCLQLALHSQLPRHKQGLNEPCLYLHTDAPFPVCRLHQMSATMIGLPANAMDNVFVHQVDSVDDVLTILCRLHKEETWRKVRLLVVDSVASLFRGRFENTGADLYRRKNKFFELASQLKRCAHKLSMAVIVTNQVVDVFGSSSTDRVGNDAWLQSSGRIISPALGLSWSTCVNTRIALVSRVDTIHDSEAGHECHEKSRTMKVIFAPHLGNVECNFVISKEGVWGV